MKTYLLSFPLAELPRLNEKNMKIFLKTFKTQGNLPKVKKQRFPTKLIENKYILNKFSNRVSSYKKTIQSRVLWRVSSILWLRFLKCLAKLVWKTLSYILSWSKLIPILCESLSNRSFLSRKGYHLQNYGESNSNMLPQNAHLSFPYFQTVASLKMKTCYFLNI